MATLGEKSSRKRKFSLSSSLSPLSLRTTDNDITIKREVKRIPRKRSFSLSPSPKNSSFDSSSSSSHSTIKSNPYKSNTSKNARVPYERQTGSPSPWNKGQRDYDNQKKRGGNKFFVSGTNPRKNGFSGGDRRLGRGGKDWRSNQNDYGKRTPFKKNPRKQSSSDDEEYRQRSPKRFSSDLSDGGEDKALKKKGEMLSYKDFLLRQKDDITPEEAQSLYDQYKKEFSLSSAKIFFERHKDEEWFQEKYCPATLSGIYKKQHEFSKKASQAFFEELQALKDDSSRLQAFLDRHQLEKDVEAFSVVGKIEAKVDAHNENERIDQIEKKLFEIRRRNNTSAQKTEKTDESDPENAENRPKSPKTAERDAGVDCDENSIFVSTVPLKVRRADLENVFGKIGGFQKICVSDPIPKYGMNRFAWVTFDCQQSCLKALELNGFKLTYNPENPPLYLHVLPKKKSSKLIRPAHFYTLSPNRVDFDLKQALKVAEALNERKGLPERFDASALGLFDGFAKIVKLDLVITYLRAVHNFCYYCGTDYVTEEGLMSRCIKRHPRNTIIGACGDVRFWVDNVLDDAPAAKAFEIWSSALDLRVSEALDSDKANETLDFAERLEKEFFRRNAMAVNNGRHRCSLCRKLFLAADFAEKHLGLRHGDELRSFLNEKLSEAFFANYERDRNRFELSSVESVIPGDVTVELAQGFYKSSAAGGGKPLRGGRFVPPAKRGFMGRPGVPRREYVDWDKPAGEGEEEIDYGFAVEATPLFHV